MLLDSVEHKLLIATRKPMHCISALPAILRRLIKRPVHKLNKNMQLHNVMPRKRTETFAKL